MTNNQEDNYNRIKEVILDKGWKFYEKNESDGLTKRIDVAVDNEKCFIRIYRNGTILIQGKKSNLKVEVEKIKTDILEKSNIHKEILVKGGSKIGIENSKVSSKNIEDKKFEHISHYDIFEKCLIRAENLISVHNSTKDIDEISDNHYCDCYRAAIVLSISALDAFVRKLIINEIKDIVANTNSNLGKELLEYIKNIFNHDKLIEAARNYDFLDRLETAVKKDFETKSFQGEYKIHSYLRLIGYQDIFSLVAEKQNLNEKKLKESLNKFTQRRHIIAHSGDYDLNSTPPKEKEIDKEFAEDCIKIVRIFAKSIHEINEDK